MRKLILLTVTTVIITSCVSKKKFTDLENNHNQAKQELVDAKADLQQCLIDKATK